MHKLGRQHGLLAATSGFILQTTFFSSFVKAVPCNEKKREWSMLAIQPSDLITVLMTVGPCAILTPAFGTWTQCKTFKSLVASLGIAEARWRSITSSIAARAASAIISLVKMNVDF
jgi:hypothetical protein